MKKIIRSIFSFALIFLLVSCGNSLSKVVSDYEGENSFGENTAYELGVNKEGITIFKDANKAFEEILKEEKEAFQEIKEQYGLEEVSKKNWKPYKTYGWQIVTENEALREGGGRISRFFDIYENSFISKDKQ